MFIQLRTSALLLVLAPVSARRLRRFGIAGRDSASTQVTYSGVVVDGYLQGATVLSI